MNIKELKKIERNRFREIRKFTTWEQKNKVKKNVEIYLKSLTSQNFLNKHIAIYWPIKDEVDLRDLKNKYYLALPKCESKGVIKFHAWDNKSPLKEDIEGILSPDNQLLLTSENISLIFVPCLAIDKRFIRLGYGGGYYDNLRSNKLWTSIPCIGVLDSKCVSNKLLTKAKWDIPLNGYITDKEIIL